MKPFEYIPKATHGLNKFDLSYDGVLSHEWGDIVPIVCKEMVPGDVFECDATSFTRLAPLAAPTYGRIHGYINYFFVPNRILMEDRKWEDFMRGGVDGTRTYTLPYFSLGSFSAMRQSPAPTGPTDEQWRHYRKLFTYMGLPDPEEFVGMVLADPVSVPFHISLLPFAAYNRIYGDYYHPWGVDDSADALIERDCFYRLPMNSISVSWNSLGGVLGYDYFGVRKACFKKDYLTTAQLRPQRGQQVYGAASPTSAVNNDSNAQSVSSPNNVVTTSGYSISAVTMRWAESFQRFLERNSIAGARYFEQILARFGVKIESEKLQRSEYIGGTDFWISVSDVTSTAATEGAGLGDYAGKGVGLGRKGVTYRAGDYGFFIALMHIMPESGSPQGIDRMWTRETRLDYFTEEFESAGNRPIYNSEVHFFPIPGHKYFRPSDSGVFGYIPQYAEYKYSKPVLAGDFRFSLTSAQQQSFGDMNSMHLYRLYQELPVLSSEFLTLHDNTEFNRIFQDTNSDFDHFWTNIQVQLNAYRPMCGYVEGGAPFVYDDKKNGVVQIPAYGTRL